MYFVPEYANGPHLFALLFMPGTIALFVTFVILILYQPLE